MKKMMLMLGVMAIAVAVRAEDVKINLVTGSTECYKAKRGSYHNGWMLRGDGAVLTKKICGPGTYYVKFKIDESNPKFKYHSPIFVFYYQNAASTEKAAHIRANDFYGILWRNTGDVQFTRHDGYDKTGKKTGADVVLGNWKKPGPSLNTKYDTQKAVEMVVQVPKAGGKIKVWLKKSSPKGEPTCEFTLPADSKLKSGSFGFWDAKWYSYILLEKLRFKSAE